LNRITDKGAVLLRGASLPTLLAICEFTADQLGVKLNPKVMIRTIDTLKDMFYLKGGVESEIRKVKKKEGQQQTPYYSLIKRWKRQSAKHSYH